MISNVIDVLTSMAGQMELNQFVHFLVQSGQDTTVWGVDLSIEGLRSRKFSIGIFAFLIVSLIIFAVIIYVYLPKGNKKLKKGEKIMFGAIIFGMVFAVVFGWLQLIEGYLV